MEIIVSKPNTETHQLTAIIGETYIADVRINDTIGILVYHNASLVHMSRSNYSSTVVAINKNLFKAIKQYTDTTEQLEGIVDELLKILSDDEKELLNG